MNMIHFLQKKDTLWKWLMPEIFVYLMYLHQQGSESKTEHHTKSFRTATQLLRLGHSLCSPSNLSSAPEVF